MHETNAQAILDGVVNAKEMMKEKNPAQIPQVCYRGTCNLVL